MLKFITLKSPRAKSLVDVARRLIAEIGYEAELKRLYTDPNEQQARWAAVEEVVNAPRRLRTRSHQAHPGRLSR